MLAKTDMNIRTAIMAWYMRRRNEGKPTTRSLLSSNEKPPFLCFSPYSPGFICNLRYWQLLILDHALRQGPPGQDTAVGFVFSTCFFAARGTSLWGQSTKRPFGSVQGAGQHQNRAGWPAHTGAFRSRAGHFVPLLNSGRGWVIKKETYGEKESRDFTLEPNHMVSIGEGGGVRVWLDMYSF